MQVEMLKNMIVEELEEKGGEDIQIINIKSKSSIADYFILATGKTQIHARSLSENLEHKIENKGINVARKEGSRDAGWFILDYIDVIVHIFNKETREFFSLEEIWK